MINLLFTSINAILIYYRFLVSPIVKRVNGRKYYRWYFQLKQKKKKTYSRDFSSITYQFTGWSSTHTEIVHGMECDLFSRYNSSY